MNKKTIIKTYWHVCLLIGLIVLMLGFICPFLISQNSWVESIGGILLIVILPLLVWWRISAIVDDIKTLKKEYSNEEV